MKKGTKIYSILHFKCPQCQEGAFLVSTPYNLSKLGDIREECDICGLKYAKEPGFYYGAMYVSYGLGVVLFVTIWASCNWFFNDVSVWLQIGLVVSFSILLGPYLFALSKIIWANLFIKYDAHAKLDGQAKTHS
jgi:uncharacterized protein (DUF983 family)